MIRKIRGLIIDCVVSTKRQGTYGKGCCLVCSYFALLPEEVEEVGGSGVVLVLKLQASIKLVSYTE